MNRIVTISREFGSGGRTIGKKLAEELGIKCYDAELIHKIAEADSVRTISRMPESILREASFHPHLQTELSDRPMKIISGRYSIRSFPRLPKRNPASL